MKGFAKKVAPSVHRQVWGELAIVLDNLGVDGHTARIGRSNYMFDVDFETETDARRAVEIINAQKHPWVDPDTNITSTIRA